MKRRLVGLVLAGDAARGGHPGASSRSSAARRDAPMLFIDLAHGLDLAEEAVSDRRRAVADVRCRAPSARADGELSRQARPGACGPASPPQPLPAPRDRAAEPPALPRHRRRPSRSERRPSPRVPPSRRRVATEVAAAGRSRTVEVTPSASAPGESARGRRRRPSAAALPAAEIRRRSSEPGQRDGRRRASATSAARPGTARRALRARAMAARWRSRFRAAGAEMPPQPTTPATTTRYGGGCYESLTYPAVARRRSLTGTVHRRRRDRASGKIGRVERRRLVVARDARRGRARRRARRGSRVPFPSGRPPAEAARSPAGRLRDPLTPVASLSR